MSKCSNRVIAKTMGQSKIDELMQVFFTVMEDIDACAKINTKKYLGVSGAGAVYHQTLVPEDMIQICESFGCKNTGTLMIIPTDAQTPDGDYMHDVLADFNKSVDATDFYGGVMYFYVHLPEEGEYNVKVRLSDDAHRINGGGTDVYETKVIATAKGFYPVSIDMAEVPSEVENGGWIASHDRVGVSISIDYTNQSPKGGMIGISSIAFFDDIADLEGNDTVVLGCLTGVDATDSLSTLDEACSRSGYDDTSASISRTVTARQWSANVDKLNPFIRKTERTEGFFMNTKKFVISRKRANDSHAYVRIPNMSMECGFVAVTMEDNCNVTDGSFTRVNSPKLMRLNERQYQIINKKVDPTYDGDGSTIYFNPDTEGQTVLISYPEIAEAVIYDATNNWLTGKRFKMTYPVMRDDGTMVNEVYHNVFPTSFPKSLSNSATEFSFEITVKKDLNGRWYEEQLINKAEYTL